MHTTTHTVLLACLLATACVDHTRDLGTASTEANVGHESGSRRPGAVAASAGDETGAETGAETTAIDDASDGSVVDAGFEPEGVIRPSGSVAGDPVLSTRDFYKTWKQRYLKPACKSGQFRIKSSPDTAAYTVSEAHGYGMLFTVMMAGDDPEARATFDGMVNYFLEHPSDLTPGLMAWAQDASCQNVMGGDAATDGDLDIAYALLVADRVWGSAGPVDYAAQANMVITAILAGEVSGDDHLLLGDWARGDAAHADGTRASDFLPQHFKAYAAARAEPRFTQVVDTLYRIVAHLQAHQAALSGLLPDFIVGADTAQPRPAPEHWLEGAHDGHYHYNACRVPWRLGTDYLLTGDPRARAAMRKLNAFFRSETDDDPTRIVDGYRLDGSAYGGGNELAFVAPLAVSAMIEPETGTNQAWLDALWGHLVREDADSYYGDSIKLGSMIVASGQWRAP